MQTLSNALIRLQDVSPLVRNTNVTGALKEKAGPHGLIKFGAVWKMFVEGVSDINNGGTSGFDFTTGPLLATAPSLQGTWTYTQSTRLIDPTNASTWENFELSPSAVWYDSPNNRLVVWFHGGNNTGPRQVGVMYSTDGQTGLAWSRDAGNPILVKGAGGATDEKGVADLKIQRLANGTWLGFYTGLEAGGASDGTIHRVTGSAVNSLTKQGRVINATPATWNANGMHPGMFWVDPENRVHLFVGAPTTSNGSIGYFYSDDSGATWTAYGSNPVASGTATAADADSQTGDVVQGVYDGDVLFLTSGGDNASYPTNAPLRGQHAFITPARVTSPVRTAKFYMSGGYTTVTGTSILSNNVFSVMGRFKAYRTNRNSYRHIYADFAAFNITAFVRIQGGGGANAGKLHAYVRTPTASTADMYSIGGVDDGQWHTFLLRRTATNAFALYLDGVQQVTDSTTVGTDATATTKGVGNNELTTGEADLPFNGTISDLVTIIGTAVTPDQANQIIEQRSFPIAVSATIDFPSAGTATGAVYTVDGYVAGYPVPVSPMPLRRSRIILI